MTKIPTPAKDMATLTELGYVPLTYPYVLPIEEEMFAAAQAQLQGGEIPWAVVWLSESEAEIWSVPENEVGPEEDEQ